MALASKAATAATIADKSTDSDTACKDIDTELSKANSKLLELQNEIARLNLLQQQQQQQIPVTGQSFTITNKTTNDDDELNFAVEEDQQTITSSNAVIVDEPTETTAENDTEKDGAFFISFGNGSAKREKPPSLTPKKNLFIKTSPQEMANNTAEPTASVSNNSLLMTAISDGKQTISKSKASRGVSEQIEIDDGGDDDSSDGDMKQRKKEMILAKQLERRQQQEIIRQQREEERMRKAEEIRMREEEAAYKKNLEKTRKETIFQAYIDKKKQLQDESQTGYHFGGSKIAQSNLANAKKYHSTYRLKQGPSQNQQNNNFNNGEFNDQASMISERSTSNVRYNGQASSGGQQQTMLKSPKLFKRLTGKSNKLAIVNSLNHRVLAGVVNAAVRKQVIDEIEASDERHFIILFRDYHLQYRAIYSYTTETDYIEKVVGVGPQKISEDMIETYFKYNSGARQFTAVPTKHFSVQCDGVSIHSIYWQSRKASNPLANVATLGGSQSTIPNNYGTVRR